MGPLKLLRTTGRRTGRPREIPVVTFRHDSTEWLVSPFGETAWVRNARANPRAELGRGRHLRQVQLTELADDDRKPDILHRYRRRYRVIPFVRQAFRATPDQGAAAFGKEAPEHPVFIVEPAD
jgi:deazaflavin-dependent oxidoreductase (nitroreductase family)